MKRKWFARFGAAILCSAVLATHAQAAMWFVDIYTASDIFPKDIVTYLGIENAYFTEPYVGEYQQSDGTIIQWETIQALTPENCMMIDNILYVEQEKRVYFVNRTSWNIEFRVRADKLLTADDLPELAAIAPIEVNHVPMGEEMSAESKEAWVPEDDGLYENVIEIDYKHPDYVPESAEQPWAYAYQMYALLLERDDLASVQFSGDYPLSASSGETITSTYGFGDINEDEQINVCDAILMSRVAAEEQGVPVTDKGKDNGDMNYDGVITAEDVMLLLKKLAKK